MDFKIGRFPIVNGLERHVPVLDCGMESSNLSGPGAPL